jgi:5-carboxymethyl-2-hydroxymuconate isomerase
VPHIVIEYSANMAEVASIPDLLGAVHRTAAESGIFDVSAIRTRAVRRDEVVVGDGNPTNGYVLVTVRMKAGREMAVRESFGHALMQAASHCLAAAFERRSITLNVEINEITGLNFRRQSAEHRT